MALTSARTRALLAAAAAFLVVSAPSGAMAPSPPAAVAVLATGQSPSNVELQRLLAPIALQPDPLLAQLLAAACYPGQMATALNLVDGDVNEAELQEVALPAAVRSLAGAPDLVRALENNSNWFTAVGRAYLADPAGTLRAIQAVRREARRAGVLRNDHDIRVITRGDAVLIEPRDRGVIPILRYVPAVQFDGERNGSRLQVMGTLAVSAIVDPLEIDWRSGAIVHGSGAPFQGSLGFDSRGNQIASGTYYINTPRPGYDGVRWRPNGTIVMPGSVSTQGSPLQPAQPLPYVLPTQPLMPARPIAPVQPRQPLRPIAPRPPVQPIAYRQPIQPLRPIQPIPSTLAGVSAPIAGWNGAYGGWYTGWNGSAFSIDSGGWDASSRGASSVGGWNR